MLVGLVVMTAAWGQEPTTTPPEAWTTPATPIRGSEPFVPDPAVATAMSGFVGFGAGHFYARDYGAGVGFAFLDTAAIGGIVAGKILLDLNRKDWAEDAAQLDAQGMEEAGERIQQTRALMWGSAGALLVAHVVDVVTAPRAATRRRR